MRHLLLTSCLSFASLALATSVAAQDGDGGGMKRFVFGLIRRGPAWSAEVTDEVRALGAGHMANIERLVDTGELVLAGPFEQAGDLAGLFVYDVDTLEEARALADSDPAVAAGRLAVDLYPWWGPAVLTRVLDLAREADATDAADSATAEPADERVRDRRLDDAEALADAYLERYVAGDVDGLAELLADDATFEDPTTRLAGRDAVVAGLREVFEHLVIDALQPTSKLVSGADRVLVSGTVEFRQDGAPYGRPGEWLRFSTPLAVSLRLRDGRVVEHLDLVDVRAFQRQLVAQLDASR